MPNTYTELFRTVLGTATSTITFSSIPSGYTDLVLVFNTSPAVSAGVDILMTFNSDTASNYSRTFLIGDGSSATSGRSSNQTSYAPGGIYNNSLYIIQIPNYSNTTTFKTPIARVNVVSQYAAATVGLWRKTPEAINRIDITTSVSSNFAVGSTFSLYGIANADQGAAKATGGIITEDSQYWYHTFGASGAFVPKQSLTCDVLVVAGGGGGGTFGGGGAGGLLNFASQSLSPANYNVTVGGGGARATINTATQGTNGVDSQFGSLTLVKGGGGGGAYSNTLKDGLNGGSGGGGAVGPSGAPAGVGGSPTSGQGFAGGNGITVDTAAGGGGGAGAVGVAATTGGVGTGLGGAGGAGLNTYSSWATATSTGVSGFYAGGGGGSGNTTAGAGGSGGGATAANSANNAGSTTANTGGGGGGAFASFTGSAGASGIVIVRYAK
jgi:hypothetical protein